MAWPRLRGTRTQRPGLEVIKLCLQRSCQGTKPDRDTFGVLRLHTLQDLDAERFRKHVSAAAASSTEQPLNRTLEIQKCVGLKKRKLCEYRVRQRLRTLRTVDPVGLQDQGKKGGGIGHGGTSSCRVMAQRWLHVDRKEDVFRY